LDQLTFANDRRTAERFDKDPITVPFDPKMTAADTRRVDQYIRARRASYP
jgi:hypothetical protein